MRCGADISGRLAGNLEPLPGLGLEQRRPTGRRAKSRLADEAQSWRSQSLGRRGVAVGEPIIVPPQSHTKHGIRAIGVPSDELDLAGQETQAMKYGMWLLFLLAACTARWSRGKAEEKEQSINSGRPGFNETLGIIPTGRIQQEMGYVFIRDGSTREHELGDRKSVV